MHLFDVIAILLVVTALASYLNYRLLGLPTTIGLMAITLLFSMLLFCLGSFFPQLPSLAKSIVEQFDFDRALLHGMLGFLLFAGALHINLSDLARWKYSIALLASIGVLLSTAIVGTAAWLLLSQLGIPIGFIYCLLFGALISPTDPIAMLGLLKQIGAPKSLEIKIAGESLFNDGVGVVIFLTLLTMASGSQDFQAENMVVLLLTETLGGAAFGFAIGYVVYWLMKQVDNYHVEILLSLALVAGGYALAEHLLISAPIAMVVAGLFIGNHGRSFAMSRKTVDNLDLFWELIDEFLTGILFAMLGLEVLILSFRIKYVIAGICCIAIVLVARWVAVSVSAFLVQRWQMFEPYAKRIMTWGGLRGGISVAMALSLPTTNDPQSTQREVILVITYVVVVFSILVQGLTIGPLTRRWLRSEDAPPDSM